MIQVEFAEHHGGRTWALWAVVEARHGRQQSHDQGILRGGILRPSAAAMSPVIGWPRSRIQRWPEETSVRRRSGRSHGCRVGGRVAWCSLKGVHHRAKGRPEVCIRFPAPGRPRGHIPSIGRAVGQNWSMGPMPLRPLRKGVWVRSRLPLSRTSGLAKAPGRRSRRACHGKSPRQLEHLLGVLRPGIPQIWGGGTTSHQRSPSPCRPPSSRASWMDRSPCSPGRGRLHSGRAIV